MNAGHVVSIVIPTYNYGQYIDRAIRSCLDQTYENLEIIVVDDGSTDNTSQIVQRFDKEINYILQENSGVSVARNKGLSVATGEFITFLDADDYLTVDSIELRVEILHANPNIGVVFCESYSKDASEDKLTFKPEHEKDFVSGKFYEDLLVKHLRFQTSTALMRSSLAKQFRFPVNISNGEDIAYFAKIFFASKAYFLVKPAVINQRHADSLRHNLEEIKKKGIELISVIFDDPYYKGGLDYLRWEFTSNRYLELFRRYYLSGEKRLARGCYAKAISMKPGLIFKIDYLVKYIKTIL